jgi:PRC-barrel domain protein
MKTHVSAALATVAVIGALGLAATPAIAAAGTTTGTAAQTNRDTKAPAARDAAPSNQATAPSNQAIAKGPPPPSGTIALAEVPDAKNTLSSIKIVDLKGDSVGSVDQVMFDNAGKPQSVRVDIGGFLGIGAKEVALDANAVKFDPAKKVLVTSLSKEQLQSMPTYKSKS